MVTPRTFIPKLRYWQIDFSPVDNSLDYIIKPGETKDYRARFTVTELLVDTIHILDSIDYVVESDFLLRTRYHSTDRREFVLKVKNVCTCEKRFCATLFVQIFA